MTKIILEVNDNKALDIAQKLMTTSGVVNVKMKYNSKVNIKSE